MRIVRLLMLTIFLSCNKVPEIENFDAILWKDSIKNCDAYRLENVVKLINQKEKIIRKNQKEITELLGKPTSQKLFKRNQKFIYYSLDCEKKNDLSVRFDALGRVKEIQIIRVQ